MRTDDVLGGSPQRQIEHTGPHSARRLERGTPYRVDLSPSVAPGPEWKSRHSPTRSRLTPIFNPSVFPPDGRTLVRENVNRWPFRGRRDPQPDSGSSKIRRHVATKPAEERRTPCGDQAYPSIPAFRQLQNRSTKKKLTPPEGSVSSFFTAPGTECGGFGSVGTVSISGRA